MSVQIVCANIIITVTFHREIVFRKDLCIYNNILFSQASPVFSRVIHKLFVMSSLQPSAADTASIVFLRQVDAGSINRFYS